MMQAESRFLQQWNSYVAITAESGVKTRKSHPRPGELGDVYPESAVRHGGGGRRAAGD